MWPKALIELLPHLTKLVPVVNRYFQSRGADDDALRVALERKLEEVGRSLHNEVAENAAAGNEVRRQLKQQEDKLTSIADDARAARSSVESLEARMSKLEQRTERQGLLFVVLFLQTAILCIVLALLVLFRHR